VKFFRDTNLAIRHARALNEMVKPTHSFTHLLDKFAPDIKDEDWIRALGREGDWIIMSGDYRIGKSVHEKRAWHESGLTAFFLKKGWTNISPLQQHSKLALLIDEIVSLAERSAPGSGFLISVNGKIEPAYSAK
jgi:hypothetical protein